MYIGLDLGTSGLKALLVTEDQRILASAAQRYPIVNPAPGLAEQDPALWMQAVRTSLASLRKAAPGAYRATRAIGLSGQMHSLLVLDERRQPLRPAILWNDTRGDDWCDEVAGKSPEISRITGVAPLPSFTSAKLAWLNAHEPERFRQVRLLLWPKDYLRLQLTGEIATDACDASGGQLLAQSTRKWSVEMLELLRFDPDYLPPIRESAEVAGQLRPAIAAELGLDQVPVVTGAGDAAASAIGSGCVAEGQAMISLGTGAVYLSAQEAYRPPQNESVHAFSHCLPDRWFSMTALLACGSVLDWACAMFGDGDVAKSMERLARTRQGPGRVLFLPFIDGTRTPVRDADIRGAFFGVDGQTDRDTMLRSVMEGVGFALADADLELRKSATVEPSPMIVGGGARSLPWCRLIATILGRPLRRSIAADGGAALGAARLAMLGAGAGTVLDICHAPEAKTVEPDADQTVAYRARFETFRHMFPAAQEFAIRT